jgi:hypothetical protein
MIKGRTAQGDTSGFGGFLDARCYVHPVAVDVAAFDDDIAQVDADAEFDRLFGGALGEHALHGDGAIHRVDDAGKLDQRAVAHEFDDAALVSRHLGREHVLAQQLERRQGAGLVFAHQPRVADHVGRHNRRKPAFGAFLRHEVLLGFPAIMDGSLRKLDGQV